MVEAQRTLAGLAFGDRDTGLLAERRQRVFGLRVVHTATGNDQGLLRRRDDLGRAGDHRTFRHRPGDVPGTFGEQRFGPVVGLRLDVLGDRHRRRAGFDGIGQHPHGTEQCGRQLLGTPYPVEVTGQWFERVVDGHIARGRQLEFLQHRGADPGGEGVGGQQQHRQPVDGRQCGAGQHVGGAGTDAGGDGPGRQPILLAGVGDRGVHHRLFVAAEHILQPGFATGLHGLDFVLQQSLTEPGHIAVAEDAEAPGEELAAQPVALDVLVGEEPNGGLGDRESHGGFGVGELLASLGRGGYHGQAPWRMGCPSAAAGRSPGAPSCRAARCGWGRRRSARPGSGRSRPSH